MKVIQCNAELLAEIEAFREAGNEVGFVPTMGALHPGHLSLVKLSKENNQVTVVSIFVNPTQFNDAEDLKKYPRTPEKDIAMLEEAGVDIVYMPEPSEVYPDETRNDFDLGGLDKLMEGKFRSGHFKGVADVVYRLFNLVKPDRAYFGEKDYQQLKIIQYMTKSQGLDVEVLSGSILREDDGLAMSSRNVRLSEDERAIAPEIYKTLSTFRAEDYASDPAAGEEYLKTKLDSIKHMKPEYVSIVDDTCMSSVEKLLPGVAYRICVAVWCGPVRLIDNLKFVMSNNY